MSADILRRIAGIEVFPVISLLLFVTVFAVALVWTLRLDAAWIGRLSRLPLDPPAPDGEAGSDREPIDSPRSRP